MKNKALVLAAIQELKPLLLGILENAGVPGFVLRVVFEDGDAATIAGGTKLRGVNEPPDENTVFMIGSCSKSFTAMTAALLAERGQVDLDAPLSSLAPVSLERDGRPVSLRHLLTNSSGLPNLGLSEIVSGKYLYGKLPGDYQDHYPFGSGESILAFVQDAAPEMVGAPGGQYIYSNEGFSLAGEVLAAAAGQAFPDLVAETLFAPLGMGSSGYRAQDFPQGSDLASGHLSGGIPAPVYFEPAIAGAGGILSTAADLGCFVLACLCEGSLAGKRVIPLSVIRQLEIGRIAHRTGDSLIGAGFGPEQYGMGLMIYPDFLGTRVITHGGSTGNFSSSLFYNRELGFGMAGLCNGGGGEGILALFEFMVTARALGKDPFSVFPVFALEKALRSLEGIYTSRGCVVSARVSYRQGRLWWESLDGNRNSPQGAHPLTSAGDPACRRFRFLNGPGAESDVLFFAGEDGLMRLQKDRNVLTRRQTTGQA